MNLPRFAEGPTTEQLCDRALSLPNREAVRLAPADQERRNRVLAQLRKGSKA